MLRDHIKGGVDPRRRQGQCDPPSTIVLSTCLLCLIVSVLHWTKLIQSYLNQCDQWYRLNAAGQKINIFFYKYA